MQYADNVQKFCWPDTTRVGGNRFTFTEYGPWSVHECIMQGFTESKLHAVLHCLRRDGGICHATTAHHLYIELTSKCGEKTYLEKKKTGWTSNAVHATFLFTNLFDFCFKSVSRSICHKLSGETPYVLVQPRIYFLGSKDINKQYERNLFHLKPESCTCTSTMSKARDVLSIGCLQLFYGCSKFWWPSTAWIWKPAGDPRPATSTLVPALANQFKRKPKARPLKLM